MIQKIHPAGAFLVTLVLVAACLLTSLALAADSVWVRINHTAEEPALNRLGSRQQLNDYGAFQWGQVSADELASLRAAGLTVSASSNPFVLSLGGESFDPLDAAFSSARFQSYEADPQGDFHLVQFNGPIHDDWLQSLRATGVELVQYIDPFAYVVWADASAMSRANSVSGLRWAGEFVPEFRVIPEQRSLGAALEPANIMVSRHVDLPAMAAELRAFDGEMLNATPYLSHFMLLEVGIRGDRYMDVGRMAGVYTVQQVQPMAHRGEMSNQAIVNSSFTSNQNALPGYQSWLTATGYDGSGVTVSIIDGGIRTTHQDLAANMKPCVTQGSPTSCTTADNSHGTHVAGAVAGNAASGVLDAQGFLRGQGVAPGAGLVQQRYSSSGLSYNFGAKCSSPTGPYCTTPGGMLVLFKEAQLSGATHANNSWGSGGIKIGYDISSQQVDVMTRDANPDIRGNQPVLPVWSIMNGNGDSAGACGNNSLGSPDEAKNLFAVGSSQLIAGNFFGIVVPNPSNFFNISANSAHGPTCDGRVGVHIIAPGCATDAPTAGSNSSYSASFCGTSMASPVVSGALAIFIERYRDLFSADPSPAMMKAAMMAVAINMHGNLNADGGTITQTPSRFQGFGRLDLDAAVNPAYKVMYFDQEEVFTGTGQDWGVKLVADDPAEPVRLMLVWTDAHGSGLAGTTPSWVNDLDLSVQVDATSYIGNQIGTDGFSQSGGSPDARNNMEAVFLRPDQHSGSAFDVTVMAANIAADALNPHSPVAPSQDFALVCVNCTQLAPVIAVDPMSLSAIIDAGGQDIRTVEIANTGRAVLDWSVDQIQAGCALPDWVDVLPMTGNLPSEDSQTVNVHFDTAGLAPETYAATLCLASNDPANPVIVLPVSMEVIPLPGELALSPAAIDFGLVQFGQAEKAMVTVTNTAGIGAQDLTIDDFGLVGGLGFAITGEGSCSDGTILDPQGAGCTVEIEFQPTGAGHFAATLSVTTTDTQSAQTELSGQGAPAPAEVVLGGLIQTFTGAPLMPTITTNPEGLEILVTYNGQPEPPTEVGTYLVEVVVDEPNYTGSGSAPFRIVGDPLFRDRFEAQPVQPEDTSEARATAAE